jgi:dihydrofolate reductase
VTKTQYYTATSIDGYIADPDNSLDWLFQVEGDGDGQPDRFGAFFAQVGAMAMGATTYQWVLDHEQLLDNPDKWQSYYGKVSCWVFTHRQLPAIPGARLSFVQGDVGPVHAAMVQAAGGRNVWLVGGGELVGRFADQGLLDEILLGVAPVFLGAGAPLLPRRLLASEVTLRDVTRQGQFAFLTYQVAARAEPGGSNRHRQGPRKGRSPGGGDRPSHVAVG